VQFAGGEVDNPATGVLDDNPAVENWGRIDGTDDGSTMTKA
jgi:hypothetical protein